MLKKLLNLILPPHCPICSKDISEEEGFPFCIVCKEKVREVRGPCCPTCGRPHPSPELFEDHPYFKCGKCRTHPPSVDSARTLLYFNGPVREGIHLFKYSGHWRLGRDLIRYFRNHAAEITLRADIILPVPLAPIRLRLRGFNQAVVLAREIAETKGTPMIVDLLVRTRQIHPQVGLKEKERYRNISGCFGVKKPERIKNKKILLVDDVLTTGATANECAHQLKKEGAESVHLLALAGNYLP